MGDAFERLKVKKSKKSGGNLRAKLDKIRQIPPCPDRGGSSRRPISDHEKEKE